MSQAKRDTILGAILALGFSLVYFVVIPAGISVPKGIKIAATAPDFWPKLISAGVALLGVVVLIQGILQTKGSRPQSAGAEVPKNEQVQNTAFLKAGAAMAALLAYCWLIVPLGIVAPSMLALPGFAIIYGERRIKVLVPLALVLPMALYFFFTRVANIPMPLGIFG